MPLSLKTELAGEMLVNPFVLKKILSFLNILINLFKLTII